MANPLPAVNVLPDGIAFRSDLIKAIIQMPDGSVQFIHGGNRPATAVVALTWNADGTFTFNTSPGFIGPVLRSPNGTKFRLSVDNNGALRTDVAT